MINSGGVGPDPAVEISARPVPQEPMVCLLHFSQSVQLFDAAEYQYMIVNLGMSKNFGAIDFQHLQFPNHLRIDWIRVYQSPSAINIGCDPANFPTRDYINKYVFRSIEVCSRYSFVQVYRSVHKPEPHNVERRLPETFSKEFFPGILLNRLKFYLRIGASSARCCLGSTKIVPRRHFLGEQEHLRDFLGS
jgi:hypothetical protein